ncbi:MAG: lysozyme inhibitor LprI family protein [Hyphomonadaceae bacterium]|nr:lysozyme inhibitor LprI family protein [Hyphomonadaceae bacterium]
MIRALALALALIAASAASAEPQPQIQPLWRMDARHLAADRALIAACLSHATVESSCLGVVQTECANADGSDTTAALRQCGWRAIAAWEDEMAATLGALRAVPHVDAAALDRAQALWMESMLADVRFSSDLYAGGTMAGVIAAQERAWATAQRTLWLRAMLSAYTQD